MCPTGLPATASTSARPALTGDPPPALDFQLSVAQASNPSSLVLPETSPRYQALKDRPDSVIEISPESHSYAAEFARRIGGSNLPNSTTTVSPGSCIATTKPKPSGGALIIDYGQASTIPTSTLRGIRGHKLVSPFATPGQVDISVDVDFTALAEAALKASEGVEVHGPVEQGDWLDQMGMKERIDMLCKQAENVSPIGAESAKRIRAAATRLTEKGGGGMGRLYKVMSILPEAGGRKPVGFGGEI